jgi:hypothetical protein
MPVVLAVELLAQIKLLLQHAVVLIDQPRSNAGAVVLVLC